MLRLHLTINGQVQGVNFRYYLSKIAQQAGISGWVRNSDTNYNVVEAVLEGNDEEVQRVVEWCRKRPSRAKVERVKMEEMKGEEGKYNGEFGKFEIL